MGGGQTSGGTTNAENIQEVDSERVSEPLNSQVTESDSKSTSQQADTTDEFETPTIEEIKSDGDNTGSTQQQSTEENTEQSESINSQLEIITENNPTDVTREETLELTSEAHDLQRHEEFKETDSYSAPTPKEFVEEHLADGNEARHIAIGYDGRTAEIGDFDSNADAGMIGSWSTFSTESIDNKTGLNINRRKSDYMYKVQIGDDTIAADTAYMTDFNVPDADSGLLAPSKADARNQMSVHAGLDAMGIRTPQHAFDSDTKQLYVEAIGETKNAVKLEYYHPDEGDTLDGQPPLEHLDKIDETQLKDVMAANLICGNADLSPDNLFVDEDGNIMSFDYDFTDSWDSTEEVKQNWEESIQYTLEAINAHRAVPLETDIDDILDHTEDLATTLQETGMVDRVADAAKEYEDFFLDEPNDEYNTGAPRGTTSMHIKRHVSSWSN